MTLWKRIAVKTGPAFGGLAIEKQEPARLGFFLGKAVGGGGPQLRGTEKLRGQKRMRKFLSITGSSESLGCRCTAI